MGAPGPDRARRWWGGIQRPSVATVALVMACLALGPLPATARTVREPVLLLHGHSRDGSANCGNWDALARQLRDADAGHASYRFSGPMVRVAYYGGDTRAADDGWGDRGCSWRHHISNHGDHARVSPSGHQRRHGVVGHTTGTSIRHLAYHLAWFIHDRYTRRGVRVDIVGQSMGGLIARDAIAATQARQRYFPKRLLVDDVVTLGTPLAGHPAELFSTRSRQTREMDHDSSFMAWLHEHAERPPRAARPPVDWTFVGSYQDGFIDPASTIGRRCDASGECLTWLRAHHRVLYDTYPTEDGVMGVDHASLRTADRVRADVPGTSQARRVVELDRHLRAAGATHRMGPRP